MSLEGLLRKATVSESASEPFMPLRFGVSFVAKVPMGASRATVSAFPVLALAQQRRLPLLRGDDAGLRRRQLRTRQNHARLRGLAARHTHAGSKRNTPLLAAARRRLPLVAIFLAVARTGEDAHANAALRCSRRLSMLASPASAPLGKQLFFAVFFLCARLPFFPSLYVIF